MPGQEILKNCKGKVKANTCYCMRTDINVNNAMKKSSMCMHTGDFVAKEFHVQFSFFFVFNQILWSKQAACQIMFYLMTEKLM